MASAVDIPSNDADADVLASLSSWSPARGFFGSDAGNATNQTPIAPFLLTPGVMDVLASVKTHH
jgi:hypothetical protein